MVGHTHEDVDQSFSLLSRYLHKNSAVSMEGTNTYVQAIFMSYMHTMESVMTCFMWQHMGHQAVLLLGANLFNLYFACDEYVQ